MDKPPANPLRFSRSNRGYRPWWMPAWQFTWKNPAGDWLCSRRIPSWRAKRYHQYYNTKDFPVVLLTRHDQHGPRSWYLVSDGGWIGMVEEIFPYRELIETDRMHAINTWLRTNVEGNCRYFTRDATRDITEIRFHAQEEHMAFHMVWK